MGVPDSPFPAAVALARAAAGQVREYALLPAEAALLGPDAAQSRRTEFTLGRGCARAALAQLAPQADTLPVLRRAGRMPLWPDGYVGAITHHRGHAAAAVARATQYRGIGVDLEGPRTFSEALIARLLTPDEVDALPPGEPQRSLTVRLIFSAKESVFKALNPATGVFLGFQDALIELPGELPVNAPGTVRGSFTWRLLAPCGAEFPAGTLGEGGFVQDAAADGERLLTGVWVER